MRKGFGIITAIIIMMTIATLMSFMIGLSSATVKQTTDVYLKQEAELMLRSTTEYALLAISGHDNNANCVKTVTINTTKFTASADIWYIGNSIPNCTHILDNTVVTSDSNYTAVLDVTVQTKAGIASEPIKLHRRTIQKP